MASTDVQSQIASKLQEILIKDALWYLVDYQWFMRFCEFVGIDPENPGQPSDKPRSELNPGPIHNGHLCVDPETTQLRQNLRQGKDFELLPESAWSDVKKWYEYDVEIEREVIEVGLSLEARIDIYPEFVSVLIADPETGEPGKPDTFPFPANSSLATIVNQFAKPEFDDEKPRLWLQNEEKEWDIVNELDQGQTLNSVLDRGGFQILLEYKNRESHEYPRKLKGQKENWRDFEIGDRLDALDTQQKWYESVVRDVKEDKILVHFEKWSARWDEWIEATSERLAPLSTHSTPRTIDRNNYYDGNTSIKPLTNGAVGLRNLGNTCFMNSTLQCLFASPVLTPFFHEKQYLKELNKSNPLGWGGKIAEEYGKLVEEVWSNKYNVVSPTTFKQAIGEFQPRFSGYQQHDSSELLSFLLDGLHEDLNRVKKKPATTAVESNNRPDAEVAKEAWERHLLRNQSIIVDHCQGQLKSRVQCPDCGKISVTFDPFMFLSVPVPKDNRISVWYVPLGQRPVKLKVDPSDPTVAALKTAIAETVRVKQADLHVVEVYMSKVYKVLKDDDSVTSDIWVHQLERPGPNSNPTTPELDDCSTQLDGLSVEGFEDDSKSEGAFTPFPVYMAKNSTYAYRRVECFGAPMYVNLRTDLLENYPINELKAAIEKAISPMIAPAPESAAPSLDEPQDDQPLYEIEVLDNYVTTTLTALRDEDSTTVNLTDPRQYYSNPVLALIWSESTQERYLEAQEQPEQTGGPAEESINVGDCLVDFTKEETLQPGDEWYCNVCKEHKQAKKKLDVWSCPDLLIIHLKRFSYNRYWRDKVDDFVDFPLEGLNMSQYCAEGGKGNNLVYDLYAVSNHFGGLGGGHYTATTKNLVDKKWYDLNDSSVSQVDSFKSNSAYVLFYKRR